jgi:CubicO group peptidase (beta-lactamase class C family)
MQPAATPISVPATPVVDAPEAAAIDTFLQTAFEGQPFRGAVLVARQGKILFSQGYGLADAKQQIANTLQTRFRLGSLTKPITAVAVLTLQAAGKLDLRRTVCSYLADCPPAWQPITLHHLLSHTSGIPELTRLPGFEASKGQPSTPAETMARFSGLPLDFAPGNHWEYSNSNYIVLGALIEQVSGQPYERYLRAAILTPLGMNDTGYLEGAAVAEGYRPDGRPAEFIDMSIPFAAGGLFSTVGDLYALDRALVQGNLLPAALRDAMFTVQTPFPPGEGPGGYGYGWVVEERPAGKVIWHNGNIEGFSTGMRRFVTPDLVIIILSNEERRNPNAVIEGIAAIVLGRTP